MASVDTRCVADETLTGQPRFWSSKIVGNNFACPLLKEAIDKNRGSVCCSRVSNDDYEESGQSGQPIRRTEPSGQSQPSNSVSFYSIKYTIM